LVLLKNPEFGDFMGMDIHIRTKKIHQWSYISNAAIRIGEELFELSGDESLDVGFHYWLNGFVGTDVDPTIDEVKVLPEMFSGYPITYKRTNSKQHQFTIGLGNDEEIVMKTWRELVRVDINGATSADFGKSSGLMGTLEHGTLLARDNESTFEDINDFGQEWQVLATEPKLFHKADGPQAPERCIMPSTSSLRRRLGDSLISQDQAEHACSGVSASEFNLCVFDVMATNDLGVAGAY